MKNNEKFLNDLENLPDRFINEIHDSENQNAVVRKSKIHWLRPVSIAACVAAAVAVPVILLNSKPDSDILPLRDDRAETSAVTTPAETSDETTSHTTVAVTEHTSQSAVTTHYTSVTPAGTTAPVTSIVITTENAAVTEAAPEEVPQDIPETGPQNENSEPETEPPVSEKYIVADDPDRDLVIAVLPNSALEDYSPYRLYTVYDTDYTDYKYKADFLITNAMKLPERYYGSVPDEETLINVTRKVFGENLHDKEGMNIVDYIEREYKIDETTGEKYKLDRPDDKCYKIVYYEDYDVWYITPQSWTYKKILNGKECVVANMWEWPPYILVRGSDGKILAFWR